MKRKNFIRIAISCLMVVLIAVCVYLRPAYICITMDGAEMDADGTVVAERELTLKGWHFRPVFGDEAFQTGQIQIEGFDLTVVRNGSYPIYHTLSSAKFSHCIVLDQNNKFFGCDIMWHEDRDFCLISVNDRFFIGAQHGDYAAVLKLYQRTISASG